MMKKFGVLCTAITIVMLLVTGYAGAEPAFTEVHTTEYICIADYSEANMWESGNIHHGRNGTQYNFATSEEPRLVGPNTVSVNWNIHVRRGVAPSWGTFYQDVPDQGGAWVGTWNGKLYMTEVIGPFGTPIWLLDGHAVGQGLGAFEGKELRLELHQELYDPADGHPCGMFPPPDPFPLPMFPVRSQNTGYIIENAGD